MFFKKRKRSQKGETLNQPLELTIEQVRQGINEYTSTLPKGVSLRSIILDDLSINYELLKPIFKGVPNRPYYMSKETFEIFEAPSIPQQIDQVQKAVDQYRQEFGEEPIIPGNPYRKISYHLIRHYLSKQPEIALYIDEKDQMVTHRRLE